MKSVFIFLIACSLLVFGCLGGPSQPAASSTPARTPTIASAPEPVGNQIIQQAQQQVPSAYGSLAELAGVSVNAPPEYEMTSEGTFSLALSLEPLMELSFHDDFAQSLKHIATASSYLKTARVSQNQLYFKWEATDSGETVEANLVKNGESSLCVTTSGSVTQSAASELEFAVSSSTCPTGQFFCFNKINGTGVTGLCCQNGQTCQYTKQGAAYCGTSSSGSTPSSGFIIGSCPAGKFLCTPELRGTAQLTAICCAEGQSCITNTEGVPSCAATTIQCGAGKYLCDKGTSAECCENNQICTKATDGRAHCGYNPEPDTSGITRYGVDGSDTVIRGNTADHFLCIGAGAKESEEISCQTGLECGTDNTGSPKCFIPHLKTITACNDKGGNVNRLNKDDPTTCAEGQKPCCVAENNGVGSRLVCCASGNACGLNVANPCIPVAAAQSAARPSTQTPSTTTAQTGLRQCVTPTQSQVDQLWKALKTNALEDALKIFSPDGTLKSILKVDKDTTASVAERACTKYKISLTAAGLQELNALGGAAFSDLTGTICLDSQYGFPLQTDFSGTKLSATETVTQFTAATTAAAASPAPTSKPTASTTQSPTVPKASATAASTTTPAGLEQDRFGNLILTQSECADEGLQCSAGKLPVGLGDKVTDRYTFGSTGSQTGLMQTDTFRCCKVKSGSVEVQQQSTACKEVKPIASGSDIGCSKGTVLHSVKLRTSGTGVRGTGSLESIQCCPLTASGTSIQTGETAIGGTFTYFNPDNEPVKECPKNMLVDVITAGYSTQHALGCTGLRPA